MTSLRIGIAQINPTVGNFKTNSAKIIDLINEAEARGLDWVIFSELALSGNPIWDLALKQSFVKANLEALKQVAQATRGKKITAMLGFVDRGPMGNPKAYNGLAVLGRGKILHKQYKTLLPTYDVFLEHIFFVPAEKQTIFKYKGLPVGLSICEDIWDADYSLKPLRELKQKGAKVIVNISSSPFSRSIVKTRELLIKRQSKLTKTHLIYVNQVGGQDDLIFDGQSLAANPQGRLIFRGGAFKEGLQELELNLGATAKPIRLKPREETLPQMYQALVIGVRDYVNKNGFKRVVIGLSGGIDSALTAVVAVDALGAERVIGVSMPSDYSSKGSQTDAEALALNLGIEYRTRPIKEKYKTFLSEIKRAKQRERSAIAEKNNITLAMENLQARLRGVTLMYISNDEGALLLTTGNKSELAMGYCTLYGDMSGGLSVLGDVYKSDVYRLSRYRNTLGKAIPVATIRKPPSAELRPGQLDQDSLPSYSVLDEILRRYIEMNESCDSIIRNLKAQRVPAKTVRRVTNAVDLNEYKRRQTPPLLRVTEKAWFGRRMPITNHFRG